MEANTLLLGTGLAMYGAPGVVGYLYGGPKYAFIFAGGAFVLSYLYSEMSSNKIRSMMN